MSTQSRIGAALRPFWGRVTVSESPVDESETDSGLVLPMRHTDDDDILRGIVLYCSDRTPAGQTCDVSDYLVPGTVVYYSAMAALKISGVAIIHHGDVLAYEEEET